MAGRTRHRYHAVVVAAAFKLDEFDVPPGLMDDLRPSVVPSWEALLAYVRAKLLRVEAADVRDGISLLLLDEQFHELLHRLTDAVRAANASGQTQEPSRPRQYHIPSSLSKQHAEIKRLGDVMAKIVADRVGPPGSPTVQALQTPTAKERVRSISDVLHAPAPVRIKKGAIATYVVTICKVALAANVDDLAHEDTLAAVLKEYLEALRCHLALALAIGLVDKLDDDVLPASYRFDAMAENVRYHEGLFRSALRAQSIK